MVQTERMPEYFTQEELDSQLELIDLMLQMQVDEINKGNAPDFRILAMVFRSFASATAYCENHPLRKPALLKHTSRQYLRLLLDCHIAGIETVSVKGDVSKGSVPMEYMLGKRTFTGKLFKRHIESLPYNWINAWLLSHLLNDAQALLYISALYDEFLKEHLGELYDGPEEIALYVHFLAAFLQSPELCEAFASQVDEVMRQLSVEDFDRKQSMLNEILPVMYCALSILHQNEEQFEHHMKVSIEANLEWLQLRKTMGQTISEFDMVNFDFSAMQALAMQRGMKVEVQSDYLV